MKKRQPQRSKRQVVLERIQQRLPQIWGEIAWAQNLPVPVGFVEPPHWVRGAIRRFLREIEILERYPNAIGLPLIEAAGYVMGTLMSADAVFSTPTSDERGNPDLKRLRLAFGAWFEDVGSKLQALPLADAGRELTAEELAKLWKGTHQAAEFIADESSGDTSSMGTLAFWMWLLWPEAESAKTRTLLHAWIREMGFVACSWKTVEKLCREIGFRSRPKK